MSRAKAGGERRTLEPMAPRTDARGGSVVYLHGVGGVRDGWDRPVRDALAGLTIHVVAPSYADLLEPGRRVYAQERRPELAAANDKARQAYVERQRRLADVVDAVGESQPWTWPSLLPRPSRLAHSLPLRQVLRVPVLGLDQMGRYLDDPARRAAAIRRATSAIQAAPRPRVVIGHSLGSLVAWDALGYPEVVVDLLITLGSPLGLPLAEGAARAEAAFPYGRVGNWLNVLHLLDPVTAGQGLHDHFPQSLDVLLTPTAGAAGPPIARLASAALRAATAHLDSTYLSSRTVAAAVRAAMCGEFTDRMRPLAGGAWTPAVAS